MITSRRMAAVDVNAEALGVPRKQLMESSGNAVARVARELVEPGASIAIVAGRGNNGGDALVTARFLKSYDVTVHLLGRPETISTTIARENWDALVAVESNLQTVTDSSKFDLGAPDLVIDAMLGTGVTGALREPEATAARAINDSDALVLSVDVPSGVDADTGDAEGLAVEADHVVTFHDTKPGLEALACDVTVADIGIPQAAELFTGPGDLLELHRHAQSHKGDHGDLLIIGGGPYTGAPALAAQAALRAGADLARVACPEHVAREVQGYSENLIVREFSGDHLAPEHVSDLLDYAADRDVVVFGPGLGDHEDSLAAVRQFLTEFDGTAVVDADALQVVPDIDTEATLICTPHQGELQKMGGTTASDWRERTDLVREFAADLGHTLLVKGASDVISDGNEIRVNRTGNPGMTVGGTGDVLAGATGALACVLPPLDAAAVAAYANGRAGDLAADEFGNGLVATDVLKRLPVGLVGEE
ncbi:NAD(P)H-hydrate dehydratase [Haloferax sp. DFSO60]|uniref:NAD(P)H-hydrate dehydratase n=1 Tax=Haloferax sp. DFSO60 TaxID=3388652 RepID=UPI00397B5F0E